MSCRREPTCSSTVRARRSSAAQGQPSLATSLRRDVLRIMPGGQLSAYDELNSGGIPSSSAAETGDVLYIQESATGTASYCLKGGTVHLRRVHQQQSSTSREERTTRPSCWKSEVMDCLGSAAPTTSAAIWSAHNLGSSLSGVSGVFTQTAGANSVGSGGLSLGGQAPAAAEKSSAAVVGSRPGAEHSAGNLQRRRRNATGRRVFRHDLCPSISSTRTSTAATTADGSSAVTPVAQGSSHGGLVSAAGTRTATPARGGERGDVGDRQRRHGRRPSAAAPVTLNGGTLSAGLAGDGSNSGTTSTPCSAGAGAHTIWPARHCRQALAR